MGSDFDIHPDFGALRRAKVHHTPFTYCSVPHFLSKAEILRIQRRLPDIQEGGSYPIIPWHYLGAARTLINIMDGQKLRTIISEKFDEDFQSYPSIMTIRGISRPSDGKIHTDSHSKVITILLYLSLKEEGDGGNLRLFSAPDQNWDEGREVSSWNGELLIFRNSPQAWHGYPSFTGKRYVLQVNYLTNYWSVLWMEIRHGLSAIIKNRPRILANKKH